MSRSSRRAVAVAIAGAFGVVPMLSGCAAGTHPQTAMPTRLVEGVNASAHQVDIRNLFILGPVPGQRLAASTAAPVYASIVNDDNAPDKLLAVETGGAAEKAEITGGPLDLPAHQLVSTNSTAPPPTAPTPPATPGTTAPGGKTPGSTTAQAPATPAGPTPTIILRNLAKDLNGGETVRLTFHFQNAGALTVNVPVEPRQGDYYTYAPAPEAPPTPTPTPSKTVKLKRSGAPTPAPTA